MRSRRLCAAILATIFPTILATIVAAGDLVPAAQAQPSRAPLAPVGLTVDDTAAPLNVEGDPQFGWLPRDKDPNETQTGYQVRVRQGDETVWDSGKVASSDQSFVDYDGSDLNSASLFSWSVRTWDRDGLRSPWASPGRFETGIDDSEWEGAAWITRDTSESDDYTLARTEVEVSDSPVVRARAYTAANHTYELFLNGERADRGTSFGYPGAGYYQAADVTDLVTAGEPLAIGIRYHWYGGGQGRPVSDRSLLHKLVIEHADGTREVAATDGSWSVTRDTRFIEGAGRRNGEGDRIDQQDGALRFDEIRRMPEPDHRRT